MDREALDELAVLCGTSLDRADRLALLDYLIELGAEEDELRAAIRTHNVGDLALDLVLRGSDQLSFADAARAAGLDVDDAARIWRALGFPDPVEQGTRLPADAASALRLIAGTRQLLGHDATVALVRVIGMSMARVAQAIVDAFRVQFEAPQLASGGRYSDVVKDYTRIARDTLPEFTDAMGAVMIRHLVMVSAGQWSADVEGGAARQELAIGFVDLTGYTALSLSLGPRELTQIVSAFEETVSDAVARRRGRVVKLLGDGAVFTCEEAAMACAVGLDVVDRAGRSGSLPPVRVALAAGSVLALGGDVFGPVVNLAARLVAVAPDDAVVVDGETRRRVGEAFSFEPLAVRPLKGFPSAPEAFRLLAPAGTVRT